jgi:hypothetical protein
MSQIEALHERAMALSDEAFLAKRQGDQLRALRLSHEALRNEVAAAELVKDNLAAEPTRSVLYRSAASLAIDCEEYREAERLIATALAGNPPVEIAQELRDLLLQIYSPISYQQDKPIAKLL